MPATSSANDIVVSTPLRTAIGTFGGGLKDTPAVDLGAAVATEVLARSGLHADQVDQVIVGNVLQAGQGMNPGRQVVLKAGFPAHQSALRLPHGHAQTGHGRRHGL
jgi:acetyl-CoA C-acetyltransferase